MRRVLCTSQGDRSVGGQQQGSARSREEQRAPYAGGIGQTGSVDGADDQRASDSINRDRRSITPPNTNSDKDS